MTTALAILATWLYWTLASLGVEWQPALAGVGVVAMWIRIEHRLTRIETKLEALPCEKTKPPKLCP